mmetsp:Transcript_43695/g.83394  ORF Transcript_43695/g.83394 Transcript_43695/m.83394 type:complete len:459 (-) Transcript_43695:169-1545(-)
MVDFMGSARVVLLSFTLVSFSVRIAAKRGGADAGGRWSSSHQPGLHIQSIIAKDPAAIDLAIVMMDNRHIASADSVAKLRKVPCGDYWSPSVAINRIWAEMHGYHFYLWSDVHNAVRSSGCMDNDQWVFKALPDLLNADIIHPAWQKMLPIYCNLKKHKLVFWMDSDTYVSDIKQPFELILDATNFLKDGKSMLLTNDHPKAGRCKGCKSDEGSNLNTGLVVMQQSESSVELLQNWMGAAFGWGNHTKVKVTKRWRMHWPWEQMAVNGPELSVYTAYRDDIVVLPYATPINGPHGQYMVHIWGMVTGYGKKCKILREALQCTIESNIPTEQLRECYLKHASHEGLGSNSVSETSSTSGSGACGWRPGHQEGGFVPSEARTQCRPNCLSLTSHMMKDVRTLAEGTSDDAMRPYRYHNIGLAKCTSKEVGVRKVDLSPVTDYDGTPESYWHNFASLPGDS